MSPFRSVRPRAARPAGEGRRGRRRRGMTLVEVIIAITILSGVTLGLAKFMGSFSQTMNENRMRAKAGQLAAQRLEDIKGAAAYDQIESFAATEKGLPGYAGFTRQTVVKRVGNTTTIQDYKIVTVIVTAPRLGAPLKKTTMISSF